MVKASPSQDVLLEEWKEARSSIGRFDEYLLNLRRYGFTLATILIGADAYVSMALTVHPGAKACAAVVVMMLIVVLSLLDHHVKTLQSVSVTRATELENQLGLGLTKLREVVSLSWQITHVGTPTYILFLLVTGLLGSVSVLTTSLPEEPVSLVLYKWIPLVFVACICVLLCILTASYSWWVRGGLTDVTFWVRRRFEARSKDKQT